MMFVHLHFLPSFACLLAAQRVVAITGSKILLFITGGCEKLCMSFVHCHS